MVGGFLRGEETQRMTTPDSRGESVRRWGFAAGVLALGLLAGCASVRNDYVAHPHDPATGKWAARGGETPSGLVVTGEERTQYSSDYFGVVDVTFENTTDRWIHIKSVRLRFDGPEYDRTVSVPEGEQLRSWARATHQRLAVSRHNRETALALVALAGMTAGLASDNRAVRATGGVAAAGALGALAVDEANQAVERAEQPAAPHTPAYYDTHLLAVPFSIPPGLFAKRWVTLSTAGAAAPCVRSMIIDYDIEGGKREHVYLPFRTSRNGSDWQTAECGRVQVNSYAQGGYGD